MMNAFTNLQQTVAKRVVVPGDLGPNQLAWCKKEIRYFAEAVNAVKKADAHAEKVKRQLGIEETQQTEN